MTQKNINAEEKLRRTAIDRLIRASLDAGPDALEFLLAKWREIGATDPGKFGTSRMPEPLTPPVIENAEREGR